MRSRAAAAVLADAGLEKIYNMHGGIAAWEGLVASGPPESGMAYFGDAVQPEELAMLAWMLEDGSRQFYVRIDEHLKDEEAKIANTSAFDGTAQVTLYFEDGTPPATREFLLTATRRTHIPVGAPEVIGGFGPAAANRRFGAVVESLPVAGQAGPAQIVVERAMYSNGPGAPFWAAGTDVLATRLR